ncbi:MAG: hypothetical protein AB7G28_22695 [Pirellulales bacterium]
MGKQQVAGSGGALADQIARQQRASVIQAAKKKLEAGEQLTTRELSELRKWEAEQTERYGKAYIAAMPKSAYADYAGRQPKQLIELAQRYGFPYPAGRADPVDVGRIIRWLHDFLAANAASLAGGSPEDAILQLASPKLKDELVRECIENKRLDNEKRRYENARLAEDYVPIEPLQLFHDRLADRIRKVRERFGRRFQGEHLDFAERLFDDLIDDIEKLCDDYFNTSEPGEQPIDAEAAGEVEAGPAS